jgi:GT2 family glycosyltransferase
MIVTWISSDASFPDASTPLERPMNQTILPKKTAAARSQRVVETSTVTIVIVSWNSSAYLPACLNAIRRATGRLQVQTVVVDNDSKDHSADLVEREFPDVRVIRSGGNLGFGRGNNLAQKHVQPGYVLILNPDTELNPDALQRMIDFLESHPDVGAVGCKMIFPDGEIADQNLQWFPNPLTEFVRHAFLTDGVIRALKGILPWNDPRQSCYVKKLYGGCIMARTTVLDQTGWFDERFFMYAEDVDLSRRIREAGWKLYYLSDAEIMHTKGGVTKGAGSDFSTLMSCESMAQLIGKYQGTLSAELYRLSLASATLLRLSLVLPLSLVSPGPRRAAYRDSMKYYWLRVKWALRLRKPIIPG